MEMAQHDDKKKKKTKGVHHRPRKLNCFTPAVIDRTDNANGGGFDLTARVSGGGDAREHRIPTHLVVTVNGIIGSAENWKFAAKQFVKRNPEDLIVHCSKSNYGSLTFDGVDVMGERLADEVLSVVARKPELRKISFVGHSLGGLVSRYAIGRLYTQNDENDSSQGNEECKTCNSGTQCVEHKVKGKIAGLQPVNFITFATPHLGSGFHKQIPILCGSRVLEKTAFRISRIAGRTGKQLFLKDRDKGKIPLLLQMVNDCEDLKFMSALQSFRRRVAYSNVCLDFIVGRKTSSIHRQHELPKRQNFVKNERYKHIVFEEKAITTHLGHEQFVEMMIPQQKPKLIDDTEEAMIKGLNRVPWERVYVSFHKSKQGIFAHNTILVKTPFINSAGADVISHMIDNFVL